MTFRNSTRSRRICFRTHVVITNDGPRLECHMCKRLIDPARERWEADHIRRWAEGGEDAPENLSPACLSCHAAKSRNDTTEVAKGKRIGEKRLGIRKAARPMPGSRASGWRKRMDGRVERR